MRRDTGSKVVELPEVRPTVHPNVECAIHPGKAIAGVAICVHVLDGAAVYLAAEPDRDAWGAMLCEACAAIPQEGLRVRLACAKCVRYHFSSGSENPGETMSDQEQISLEEREGLRSYRAVRDGRNARAARCPFESDLLRWAWNLGFRLGQHLDEARIGLRQTIPQ